MLYVLLNNMTSHMEQKTRKLEVFINETLKVDLRRVLDIRDKVYQDIAHYLQLKSTIEALQENELTSVHLKTQVDLGCNFFVQAKVPDPSKICVNVGLGFYVEFTLAEAVTFIDKKIALLNSSADSLSQKAAKIKAHIKLVLEGLREIQNISLEEKKQHIPVW